jgi:1,4-dihydroxy-2-naphthoate octaprenyltransferase
VLLVLFALPLAQWLRIVYSFPKPPYPPVEIPNWPLWFVNFAFLHNRRFGILYLVGIVLDLALRAFLARG